MHKLQLLRIMCKNSINKVARVLATILLVRHIRQPPKNVKTETEVGSSFPPALCVSTIL